ncbi:MAG: hypothetical protein A2V79_01830 [Betaproteobacteria bacterium RBG_16_56_24]|nr:MAG: hypothetical protein A2V79_01830 [Betaproteobacteria bacterium RBG_16_56_24]
MQIAISLQGASNNCLNFTQKNGEAKACVVKRQEERTTPEWKRMKGQPGFFDLAERRDKLTNLDSSEHAVQYPG